MEELAAEVKPAAPPTDETPQAADIAGASVHDAVREGGGGDAPAASADAQAVSRGAQGEEEVRTAFSLIPQTFGHMCLRLHVFRCAAGGCLARVGPECGEVLRKAPHVFPFLSGRRRTGARCAGGSGGRSDSLDVYCPSTRRNLKSWSCVSFTLDCFVTALRRSRLLSAGGLVAARAARRRSLVATLRARCTSLAAAVVGSQARVSGGAAPTRVLLPPAAPRNLLTRGKPPFGLTIARPSGLLEGRRRPRPAVRRRPRCPLPAPPRARPLLFRARPAAPPPLRRPVGARRLRGAQAGAARLRAGPPGRGALTEPRTSSAAAASQALFALQQPQRGALRSPPLAPPTPSARSSKPSPAPSGRACRPPSTSRATRRTPRPPSSPQSRPTSPARTGSGSSAKSRTSAWTPGPAAGAPSGPRCPRSRRRASGGASSCSSSWGKSSSCSRVRSSCTAPRRPESTPARPAARPPGVRVCAAPAPRRWW